MRRVLVILAVILGTAVIIGGGVGGFLVWHRAQQREIDKLRVDARAAMQAGQIDEAARLFSGYLRARRNDQAVRREYADLILKKIQSGPLSGKANLAAFNLLEQAVRETPDDHWLRFQLAKFQVQIQQVTSALEHLKRLHDLCPPGGSLERPPVPGDSATRSVFWHEIDALRGEALEKTGRFREAVDVLSGIVGFDPVKRSFPDEPSPGQPAGQPWTPSPTVFQQLAHVLEKVGDVESVGLVHARNTVVNAGTPQAWIMLAGWKFFHDHDTPAALEAVKKATAIAPDDSSVMYSNFQIAMISEKFGDAAAIAARGLELHPDEEWPYSAVATVALRKKDVAGTIAPIIAGLEKLGARPPLLQLLVDLPDEPPWNSALESRLSEIQPTLAKQATFAVALSGRMLMAKGKWLEAARALETSRPLAVALPALKLAIDLALAKCYAELGDFDLQLAAGQRAIQENPKSTTARLALAAGLLATGQSQPALREFRGVAAGLTATELATRPDVWVPLVRLERTAIDRRWPNRRGLQEVDSLRESLETGIPADMRPLLEAEWLAGGGEVDAAVTVLAEARRASPNDVGLAAAAVRMQARSNAPAGVVDLLAGLPEPVRESAVVATAACAACRVLPISTASAMGDMLRDLHPDDLNAVMTSLIAYLHGGQLEAAKDTASRVDALAGSNSTHAQYAAAAVWALEKRLTATRLSRSEREEAIPIRNRLAEIELQRPEWPALHCLVAEIALLEGNFKEAVSSYMKALAARPDELYIARSLVQLLMRSQRYAAAEQALSGLDPAVLGQLDRITAELRLRNGKTGEALEIAATYGGDEPDELLWFADLLTHNGRQTEAVAALERGVTVAPARIDIWLALADQQAGSAGPMTASETIDRALEAVPSAGRDLLLAERERLTKGPDQASVLFEALLREPTQDLLLLQRAANCFAAADLEPLIRTTLDAMTRIQPRSPRDAERRRWAMRRLAEPLLREGTFPMVKRAIDMLRENSDGSGTCTPDDADLVVRLLAQRPEPESWRMASDMLDILAKQQPLTPTQKVLTATLRERLGDWRTARADLLDMTVDRDMPAELYATLADLLIKHDDVAAAQRWLPELQSRAPDAPGTIALQVQLARARDDKRAAVEAARRLMPDREVTAETVSADLATAAMLESLGFATAAEKLLSRCAEVSTDGVLARAAFLLRQKRPADAAIESARGQTKTPRPALLAAEILEAQNEPIEAEKAYREVLAMADVPADVRARATARLVACLIERDQLPEAYRLVDQAILDIGPHPELLDARGLTRVAAGDHVPAIKDFTEAVLAPSPIRLLHLAHVQCLIGNQFDARSSIEQSLKQGLDTAVLLPGDRRKLDFIRGRLGLETR